MARTLTTGTRRTLVALFFCWLIYAAVLTQLLWLAPVTRLWLFKSAIAVFGLFISYLSFRARVRWQPWVFASAAAYLALFGLVAASIWLRDGISLEAAKSMITDRLSLLQIHMSSGTALSTARYAIDAVLMPAVQAVAVVCALVRWRVPPSNSTPHADARDVPASASSAEARAGGRER
jgi:hypothetical protein